MIGMPASLRGLACALVAAPLLVACASGPETPTAGRGRVEVDLQPASGETVSLARADAANEIAAELSAGSSLDLPPGRYALSVNGDSVCPGFVDVVERSTSKVTVTRGACASG